MAAPLEIRVAREDDLDRLVEIHAAAFPDARSDAERRRNFEHNPFGPLASLHVAVRDDVVVAHAFLFSFTASFGGSPVPVGGIASVGVAPEARGSGVATALLHDLHAKAAARGDLATVLYAFRQGFYVRLGYAPVAPSRRLVFSPSSVPAAWRDQGADLTVRGARGEDRAAIEALHARMGARATGWLTRSSAVWEARLLNERRAYYVVQRSGRPVGYVAWRMVQDEAHAAVDLVVDDLVADDDEARCRLFGLVAQQRDHVRAVHLFVDLEDPIDHALLDADRFRHGDAAVEHPLGELVGGPLVRLVDPRRALEARGYAHDGELVVGVLASSDAPTPEATLRVEVANGRARVTPAPETPCDVTTDRATLGAVAYGGILPSRAARLRLFSEASAGALVRADALLALPPFFSIDPF